MQVIRLKKGESRVVLGDICATLGQFDGFHEAHQHLLDVTIQYARENSMLSALFTFDPHPAIVLGKTDFRYLTPLELKEKYLQSTDLDILYIIEFDHDVANLLPQQFVEEYLLGIGVKHLVVGFDYRYGKNRQGDVTTIQRDSKERLTVEVISEMRIGSEKIGSTLVRKLLSDGQLEKANKLLKRPYSMIGLVEKGRQVGQTLNLPTANIAFTQEEMLLNSGVYFVRTHVQKEEKDYLGICNIGHNPSFNYQKKLTLEVHILDYYEPEPLYGKMVEVSFFHYARPEMTFTSKDDFMRQIYSDIRDCREYFSEPYLTQLNEEDEAAFQEFLGELISDKDKIPAILRIDGKTFKEWLMDMKANEEIPNSFGISSITYFLKVGKKIVGHITLRLTLNDNLLNVGGHVGYGVISSERKRGYATLMLKQMCVIARSRGFDRLLVTCNKDNVASEKTILKCGGVYENEVISPKNDIVMRYWIDLSKNQ